MSKFIRNKLEGVLFVSKSNFLPALLAVILALSITGCQNLPGSNQSQGAVIGGLGGAAAGAAIGGEHNRLLGALLGGALGAGGGYVIGANSDKILGRDRDSAAVATQNAQTHPATAEDVRNAPTADLNHDGFVTLDEVAAMRQAGLSDDQMMQRLQATGQVFELTPEQRNYLRSRGVSDYVINQMENINHDRRQQLLNSPANTTGSGVISQPAPRY
ncbi:MAG: OmpA family protein [Pedosphaera sp.]|nr:OmpA family protein [Pedosphaera sp.]